LYRSKFCAECGNKIVDRDWRRWFDCRFCMNCKEQFSKSRWILPTVLSILIFSIGWALGKFVNRSNRVPLVIEQASNVAAGQIDSSRTQPTTTSQLSNLPTTEKPTALNETIYICGARTKKGTPCSRRVREIGRCWQHKGKRAMLPDEKLIIKE
jgi:hypothetical protein